MSKTKKNKSYKKNSPKTSSADLLESPEALSEKVMSTEKFIRQNRIILGAGLALIVLVVAAFLAYQYWQGRQESQAQEALFPGVHFFEKDSLNLALKGNDSYPGLEEVKQDYSSTKAANLARFYSGLTFMEQGKFAEAIQELEDFSSSDLLVQARAYLLIGDANMELEKYSEAASAYQKAVDYKPNPYFTPRYLLKLGLAQEKMEKYTEAIASYDEIIEKYYQSSTEFTNAKKYKSRLESLAKK